MNVKLFTILFALRAYPEMQFYSGQTRTLGNKESVTSSFNRVPHISHESPADSQHLHLRIRRHRILGIKVRPWEVKRSAFAWALYPVTWSICPPVPVSFVDGSSSSSICICAVANQEIISFSQSERSYRKSLLTLRYFDRPTDTRHFHSFLIQKLTLPSDND